MIITELKVEKIYDMSMPQSVGHISNDPRKQEYPSPVHQQTGEVSAHHNQGDKGHAGYENEKSIAIMQHPERRTGIINVGQAEKSWNDGYGPIEGNELQDNLLSCLINQCKKQNQ